MNPPYPDRDGVGRSPLASGELAQAGGVPTVRAFQGALGLAQVERMLAAMALHPHGAGFDRVHFLYWHTRSERLAVRLRASATHETQAFVTALERARDAVPDGMEINADGGAGRHGVAPAALEGPAGAAWERGASEIGDGGSAQAPWCDGERVGAVPLRCGTRRIGIVVGEWKRAGERDDRQAALEAFAAIADWSLGLVERTREAEDAARRATAMAEFARATVSPLNLAEVLHLTTRLAVEVTGARGGALWVAPAGRPRLEVTFGTGPDRERMGRALEAFALEAVTSAKPRVSDRPNDEFLLSPGAAAGVSSLAVYPFNAYGRTLGAVAIYDRVAAHPADPTWFDRGEREFLAGLADLAALAIDHAEKFRALRDAEQRQRELQARLGRQERLSVLSGLAGRMAEEARNPVASILAFAQRALDGIPEGDPGREYLEIVMREATRLELVIGQPQEAAGLELPALRVQSLNETVQETLQSFGEFLVRRRVRLVKKLSADLPSLLLDRDRIRHVITRILESALESVAIGGRIRVETRRAPQHVIVEVAHDGLRGTGDGLEQLFVPFATGRSGGAGLGLEVVQRIVRDHGGEIRVRAEGDSSTVIGFTLPVNGNQDRRRATPERRRSLGDRRSRWPEAS
jgi:signal transduction histidine kinase